MTEIVVLVLLLLAGLAGYVIGNYSAKPKLPKQIEPTEYWPGTKVPKTTEWIISGEASSYMEKQERVLRERALYTIAHNKVTAEGGTHYINMEVMKESVKQAIKELANEN
jgi:hypothetical protein